MNVREFYLWMKTEPDDYELLDGVPRRIPEYKQGGRRRGCAYRAAVLCLPKCEVGDWLVRPLPAFGDKIPLEIASESWVSLCRLLATLPEPAGPEARIYGESFADIIRCAHQLAEIECQRQLNKVWDAVVETGEQR